jgi:hypothetical protein
LIEEEAAAVVLLPVADVPVAVAASGCSFVERKCIVNLAKICYIFIPQRFDPLNQLPLHTVPPFPERERRKIIYYID